MKRPKLVPIAVFIALLALVVLVSITQPRDISFAFWLGGAWGGMVVTVFVWMSGS